MLMFTVGTQAKSVLIMFKQWLLRLWDRRTGKIWDHENKKLHLISNDITHFTLQEELNESYLGSDFPFEVQYGSLLTVIFVNVTYAPAMPLMNLIALESLVILYFMNKTLLLRFYRTPPAYSADLPKVITFMMLGAAFIHCW